MKLTVTRGEAPRYLRARLGRGEKTEPRELALLAGGKIPCLLPLKSVQGRRGNILEYEITGLTTLRVYLSCLLTREQMEETLVQCVELFKQTQAAYLNRANLVLDPEHIYVTLQERRLHFVYLPVTGLAGGRGEAEFFRGLLGSMTCDTYEKMEFARRCTAYLNSPVPFTLSEFQAMLRQEAPVPTEGAGAGSHRAESAAGYGALTPEREAPVRTPPGAGATALLGGGDGATVPLWEAEPPVRRPWLIRVKTGERIPVGKDDFMIGKEPATADYLVSDNGAVSRSHARLVRQEAGWTVLDCGSTNRTFINGVALTAGTPQPIADGDTLRLGNEEFTFHGEA